MPDPLNVPTPISSRLDPDKPTFISVFGKKGSGKSVMARRFWDSWPRDACCIDVTKDALKPEDVQENFYGEVPERWPLAQENANGDPLPRTIRYVPYPRATQALYHDNLDRSLHLAAQNPGSLLWIDEISIVSRVNRTGPYLNHLLIHGRHDHTSVVFCGPRSMGIDPLILAQSDFVYIFELPGVADRRRIAETCGIEVDLLDEAVHALPKGGHDYLRWDGVELVAFPPLPLTRTRVSASPPQRTGGSR
jgi:hypothetical protein